MKKSVPSSRVPAKTSPARENADQSEQPNGHSSTEAIEGVVERRLEPVLSNLSRVQREQVISTVVRVVKAENFSGPVPHPKHLREYNEILPGSADRLIKMTEDTIEHNLSVMRKAQSDDNNYRTLGMWLGFGALIMLVVSAVYAGMNGNNVLAGLLLGTTILSSIGVFVTAHLKGSSDE